MKKVGWKENFKGQKKNKKHEKESGEDDKLKISKEQLTYR